MMRRFFLALALLLSAGIGAQASTTLYLRNTHSKVSGYYDLEITRGPGAATGVVNTASSGTNIQWTKTAAGLSMAWISAPAPVGGFTLDATATFNLWVIESNIAANAGARARLYKYSGGAEGAAIGAWDDGVEFSAVNSTAMNWTGNPAATDFAEGDRLVVKFFITNIGTMGGSRTCTMAYAGNGAGSSGDSYVTIGETVTFKTEITHIVRAQETLGKTGNSAQSFTLNSTASGEAVIVAAYASNGSTPTVEDDQTNTYHLDASRVSTEGVYIISCLNPTAAVTTVTVTPTGGGYVIAFVGTYLGLSTTGLDKTSGKTNANSATYTSDPTATTTQNDELLVGVVGTGFSSSASLAPSGSWVYPVPHMPNSGDGDDAAWQDQIIASTGTPAATGTSSSLTRVHALIATYKAAITETKRGQISPNPF
jgi:hypothetical protein